MKRAAAKKFIVTLFMVLMSPFIILTSIAVIILYLCIVIISIPIGIWEWAYSSYSDHPIGWVLDWIFPEEDNDEHLDFVGDSNGSNNSPADRSFR